MINLLLSILSSVVIMVVFKIIEKQKTGILSPVVINYITASVLGFIITNTSPSIIISTTPPWLWLSVMIGILLIVNFYIIGLTIQKSGIATTTISAKMSFVLPVLFSLLFDINDTFNVSKSVLILLAIVSVFLVVYPNKKKPIIAGGILYPVLLFIGLGVLDSLVKYCQYNFITTPEASSLFSAVNFSIAGIIGITVILFSKRNLSPLKYLKTWIIGIVLGIANFGSMYFLINALNSLKYDNSLVFGINNIGVVGLSVAIAIIIFKERFSLVNKIGLVLSMIVLAVMIRIFI